MLRAHGRTLVAAVAVTALLAAASLGVNGYYLSLLYQTVLFVALAYAWNIISGYAGYFSFGQVAFFGIGAYITALAVINWHWHWLAASLFGGAVSLAVAIPAGYVMLRLRGPFFALGMFGLAQTARVVFGISEATGGGSGLYLPPGSNLHEIVLWTLALALAAFLVTLWISDSAFGLRLQALREDEAAAGTLGVDVTAAKIRAFALSALIPGLLGGGYAWFLGYVEPQSVFSNRLDLESIVMALFGGIGTLWGPLVGALLLTQISEALWASFPQAYLMIFGGLVVVLLIFMPQGLVPAIAGRMGRGRPPSAAGLQLRSGAETAEAPG